MDDLENTFLFICLKTTNMIRCRFFESFSYGHRNDIWSPMLKSRRSDLFRIWHTPVRRCDLCHWTLPRFEAIWFSFIILSNGVVSFFLSLVLILFIHFVKLTPSYHISIFIFLILSFRFLLSVYHGHTFSLNISTKSYFPVMMLV